MKKTVIFIVFFMIFSNITAQSYDSLKEIIGYNYNIIKNEPNFAKIKFEKMAFHPFSFYRGTAHLFYLDFTQIDVFKNDLSKLYNKNLSKTWIQGDLHLENFGFFKDENERIIYDMQDFDESYKAPYAYDIIRVGTSIYLASKDRFSVDEQDKLVEAFFKKYYKFLDDNKSKKFIISNDTKVLKKRIEKKMTNINDSQFLQKLVNLEAGKFIINERNLKLNKDQYTHVSSLINEISQKVKIANTNFFNVKDIIFRAGKGTGSIGCERFYALIEGNSEINDDDKILQIKESLPSSLENYIEKDSSLKNITEAQRVYTAYKAMQYKKEQFVTNVNSSSKSYIVSEISKFKEKINLEKLDSFEKFEEHIKIVAKLLARAHLIANNKFDKKFLKANGSKKEFIKNSVTLTQKYYNKVLDDYNKFLSAYEKNTLLISK